MYLNWEDTDQWTYQYSNLDPVTGESCDIMIMDDIHECEMGVA